MPKKSILALCLAAAAVIFGGFLPKLSALALDRIDSGKPVYQTLTPIQLQTAGNPGWQSLSLMEKLSLLRFGGQIVHVGPGIMRSTEEEIWEFLMEGLDPYREAGLLPDIRETDRKKLVPCLIFDAAGSDRCDLFWQVDVTFLEDNQWMELACVLDDETGQLMVIHYAAFGDADRFTPANGKLEQFARLYFEQLGLQPDMLENTGDYLAYLLESDEYIEHYRPSKDGPGHTETTPYGVRVDLFSFRDNIQMQIY